MLACTAALGFSLLTVTEWRWGSPLFSLTLTLPLISLAIAHFTGQTVRPPKDSLLALGIIGISAVLSIPGSLIWGDGNWGPLLLMVLWMLPLMSYVFIRFPPATWLLMAITAYIHLFATVAEIISGLRRPEGLMDTYTASAGFLLLTGILLLPTRWRWLSVPLLVSVVLPGARWALVVVAVMLVAMFMKKFISPRLFATISLGILLSSLAFAQFGGGAQARIEQGLARNPAMEYVASDLALRLQIPHLPSFLPTGLIPELQTPHSAPLRAGMEFGILTGVAWLWLTMRGLWQRKWGQTRWGFLAVALLSSLDLYTWVGSLAWSWWALQSQGAVSEDENIPVLHSVAPPENSDSTVRI